MELKHLHAEHYEELIDLLDGVFSRKYGKITQFRPMFPRIYGKADEFYMNCHLGAFEGGRLVGCAAANPLTYRVGSQTVQLSADGNVAVHEDFRGRGIMSAMMEQLRAECTADISYLHGKADRYARFGYIGCGRQSNVTYEGAPGPYTFAEMTEEDVPACREIAAGMADHIVRRPEEFIPALRTHSRFPTVIRDADGALCGYLTHENGEVAEYALRDRAAMAAIFGAFAAQIGGKVSVLVSGYEPQMPGEWKTPALIRINRPIRMLEVGFAMASPACDGALTIDSALTGCLHIEVRGGRAVIEPTQTAADIVLDDPHTQLFGLRGKTGNALFDSWFPLPLYAPYLT